MSGKKIVAGMREAVERAKQDVADAVAIHKAVMTTDERRARAIAAQKMGLSNAGENLPDDLWMQALPLARAIRESDEAAGMVLVKRKILEELAPESPMNQDEMGGCVWCGGTGGTPYGYAGRDPADHEHDCPWVEARAMIAAATEADNG